MEKHIALVCTPLTFYSNKDEDALFEWLYKLKCIEKIKGIGKELHLSVNILKMAPNDIHDFVGIFKRYKFKNYKQLQQLSDTYDWDDQSNNRTTYKNIYPQKSE